MNHSKRLLKIAEKILADVHFSSHKEFDEYLKNHPDYREDTKFYVNGVQVKAPQREKNNDMEKLVKILEEKKYAVSESGSMIYAWKTSRGDGCNVGTTVTIVKSLIDDKYKITKGYFEFYTSFDTKYNERERVILRKGNVEKAIERLKQYA